LELEDLMYNGHDGIQRLGYDRTPLTIERKVHNISEKVCVPSSDGKGNLDCLYGDPEILRVGTSSPRSRRSLMSGCKTVLWRTKT
jgi:hypothetical protein